MDLRDLEIELSTPHPDESFDCTAAMDVLEHAESFEDSLGRIVANLKRVDIWRYLLPWTRSSANFSAGSTRTRVAHLNPERDRLREFVQEHNLTVTVENKYTPTPVRQKIPLVPA